MTHKLKRIICLLLTVSTLAACTAGTENNTDDRLTQEQTESPFPEPCDQIDDLTAYVTETRGNFIRYFDFTKKTVATYNEHMYLTVSGRYSQNEKRGLTSSDPNGCISLSEQITAFPYNASVKVYNSDGTSDPLKTALIGIGCTSAGTGYENGGVWFYFNGTDAYLYEKSAENAIKLKSGVADENMNELVFSGDEDGIQVLVNGECIAYVKNDGQNCTVSNAESECVLELTGDNITFDGNSHGYLTVHSNRTQSSVYGITLEHKQNVRYSPKKEVLGFKNGYAYSFLDKKSYYHSVKAFEHSEKLYAEAFAIAQMLGFECSIQDGSAVITADAATVTFVADRASINVNGQEYKFPKTVASDGAVCISVIDFLTLFGYDCRYDDENGILVCDDGKELTPNSSYNLIKRNFELYESVIFNYDDVKCDQTGVGKFDPVDPSERTVGIAYSPWNCLTKTWWRGAWDKPLYGIYANDDEDVLLYHARLLAEADVDFVFVDWSNNTYVTEETYHQYEIYRVMEHATYEMFRLWSTVPNAPKIAVFIGPGHATMEGIRSGAHQKKADQIYTDLATNEKYRDMYFYYEGKPLLLCYGATPTQYGKTPQTKWDDERFTVRWVSAHLDAQNLSDRNGYSSVYWSWEEHSPQSYTELDGKVEAVTVSAAIRGGDRKNRRNNGATFKRQMQRAIDLGAKITIITTWNEWTASEQRSDEESRDIEPSVAYGTFYYDLMREQIKKLKGKI